jgi:hypothetical protein
MTRILLASALLLTLAAPAFAETGSATTTVNHHSAVFERHSEPWESNSRPKSNDPYWTKCDYYSYNDVNGCE